MQLRRNQLENKEVKNMNVSQHKIREIIYMWEKGFSPDEISKKVALEMNTVLDIYKTYLNLKIWKVKLQRS